jgi:hypothetical protein
MFMSRPLSDWVCSLEPYLDLTKNYWTLFLTINPTFVITATKRVITKLIISAGVDDFLIIRPPSCAIDSWVWQRCAEMCAPLWTFCASYR